MKFFLSVLSAKSHLNPMIAVAQSLEAMGHEVGIYADTDIRETLSRAGLRTYLGYNEIAPLQPNREKIVSIKARQHDKDELRRVFKDLLVDSVPGRVDSVRRVMQAYNPDMVLTDPIFYPAVIAAALEKKKWAALSCSLNPVLNNRIKSDLLDVLADIDPARRQMFAAYGLPDMQFEGWDCLSPLLTTCFTTREFTGYEVAGVSLVGPAKTSGSRGDEYEFPWSRLVPGKRKILVSFGSELCYQPDYFRKIVDAFRFKDIQLILAAGQLAERSNLPKLGPLPSDTIVVQYAPQPALLEKIDLFISHGGANSVMEALTCGVPLLLAPLYGDQFHQLWFVKNAGVGDGIDLAAATKESIEAAAKSVMDSATIRLRLKRIKKSYEKNGAQAVVELCVRAAEDRAERSAWNQKLLRLRW